MQKKKEKPEILWSIDFKYKQHTEHVHNSLYEIHKAGKGFVVMYYGTVDIFRANSFEEAKMYQLGSFIEKELNLDLMPGGEK